MLEEIQLLDRLYTVRFNANPTHLRESRAVPCIKCLHVWLGNIGQLRNFGLAHSLKVPSTASILASS